MANREMALRDTPWSERMNAPHRMQGSRRVAIGMVSRVDICVKPNPPKDRYPCNVATDLSHPSAESAFHAAALRLRLLALEVKVVDEETTSIDATNRPRRTT